MLRQGLRELGYVEGNNVVIDARYAGGQPTRYRELAEALVRAGSDVIVASGPMIPAAQRATGSIPIVMSASSDPVAQGLVTSLARPTKNVTGLALASSELNGKRLQLLAETLPNLSRVGILTVPGTAKLYIEDAKTAAQVLGIQVELLSVFSVASVEPAFKAAVTLGVQAVVVTAGGLGLQYQQPIIRSAARHRVPASISSASSSRPAA